MLSTPASVISATRLDCEKPKIVSTEETHNLYIAIFVSASLESNQQVAPILAKRFAVPHVNHGYAKLMSVTPNRGDFNGGTSLTIELRHNPLVA